MKNENWKNYISKIYRPVLEKKNLENFICLDKNEPPYSAFYLIKEVLKDADIKSLNKYPDPYKLYIKLSEFVHINPSQLLITFGSEQAIRFVFDSLVDLHDEVVYPDPSFEMLDLFAYCRKCKVTKVPHNKNRELSAKSIANHVDKKTRLLVLANPNNKTGTAYSIEDLKYLAEYTYKTKTCFLIDEAYFHYYNTNSVSLLQKHDHIIITRTFSKAFGLAGLRIGYAISNRENIDLLRKQKPIDEITSLSYRICLKTLENASAILKKNVDQVKKWKKIFENAKLTDMYYLSTEGNFILLKSNKYEYHKKLFISNAILAKHDFSTPILKNCFRFSVSNDYVMRKILALIN